MTAARAPRRTSAPRLPRPQLVEPPTEREVVSTMADRRFDSERELIATPCDRFVEREQVLLPEIAIPEGATPEWLAWWARQPRRAVRDYTYQLWEPLVADNRYRTTKVINGKLCGLAHTRIGPPGLTYAQSVQRELSQQHRAVRAMLATCRELKGTRSDAPSCNCGVLRLFGSPSQILANIESAEREARAKQ